MHTSLEFSKKLTDNGCRLEGDRIHYSDEKVEWSDEPIGRKDECFDILNDICVKYGKEFFGDYGKFNANMIIMMMIDGTIYSQKDIEKHIWNHCKFNSDNK